MRVKDKLLKKTVFTMAFISILIMSFVMSYITNEGTLLFKDLSIVDFIFNREWSPIGGHLSFGIFPIILSTFYTAFLSILISLPIGIFTSLFIVFYFHKKMRRYLKVLIRVLAGIPSVVYGFLGSTIVIKHFELYFNRTTGESVLIASIILSIMVLPFFITTLIESFEKIKLQFEETSDSLGVSKEYMIIKLILPKSLNGIIIGISLSLGRAIGETMAVMMVIGNSRVMPKLLGRGQTISGLIALEMGSAELGSYHYQALCSAGFLLLLILLLIGTFVEFLKYQGERYEEV